MSRDDRHERLPPQKQQQHQPMLQQHFFTTPRMVVDYGTSPGDLGSTITKSQSYDMDSRNPTATSYAIRNERDDYDGFSSKVRDEMRRVQAEVRDHGATPPTTFFNGSSSSSTSSFTKKHRPASSNVSVGSIHSFHHRDDDQRSVQSQRRYDKDSYSNAEEQIKRIEQEVANERRQREEHKHVLERNKQLKHELSTKDSEIAQLKRQLQDFNNEIATKKDQVKQTYEQDLKNIEREYKQVLEETVAENESLQKELLSAQRIIHEMENQTNEIQILRDDNSSIRKILAIAEQDVELTQRALTDIEVKYDKIVTENMRIETQYADMKMNYANLTEDKIEYERENTALTNELNDITEEHNSIKKRLRLLDRVTDELECALAEKDDAVMRCKALRENNTMLEIDIRSLKNGIRTAMAEKDEVLTKYNALERDHARLQGTKETESHLTGMVTKQRDKMGEMMERYMEEICELKSTNSTMLKERDDLKEELICVLETASGYQDY